MALVGKLETRPTSTTSMATYRALVIRCLLCGDRTEHVVSRTYTGASGDAFVPRCECYDDSAEGPLQPVRIIPNDR